MPDPRDLTGDEAEDAYDAEYLREVAGGDARQQRLEELKRRIAQGAYHPDPRSIAEGMLSRAGEPEPREEGEDDSSG
ncbi:MAG TPA: flagellar biosynthesis anti-sigma factor FlgM [Myxococcota bacterium]|nr:flagellar biosynthesis anti-sigma factor FlgM [Myxococcota bacterium]